MFGGNQTQREVLSSTAWTTARLPNYQRTNPVLSIRVIWDYARRMRYKTLVSPCLKAGEGEKSTLSYCKKVLSFVPSL